MAEPSKKSAGINSFLSALAGKDREATIKADLCMFCDGPAKEFRHPMNFREYLVSGMCQICQDRMYGYTGDDGVRHRGMLEEDVINEEEQKYYDKKDGIDYGS